MFKLDLAIFNFIYSNCKILGSALGYGAREGFVIYLGIFGIAITRTINKRKAVKK